jgi:mono/diheme cytochrome c family protein
VRKLFASSIVAIAIFAGPCAWAGDPVQEGNQIFQYWCASCHGKGPGHPGTDALQKLYKGSLSALLEERTDLTPDVIATFVRHGNSIMPFFRKTEISDADLAAIGAYLSRKGPNP